MIKHRVTIYDKKGTTNMLQFSSAEEAYLYQILAQQYGLITWIKGHTYLYLVTELQADIVVHESRLAGSLQ